MTQKNKNIGSNFDDFLTDEGILEEVEARAAKRAIVIQLNKAMKYRHITKSTLAENVGTSRAAIDRLLNPDNIGISMKTMFKVARALKTKINISFEPTT